MDFVCEVFGEPHDASSFESGRPALDEWLLKSARGSDGRNLTRTYVWHRGDGIVLAYFTLMPYLIERGGLGTKQGRGLADRIPCYLIARLALSRHLHGQGLGSQLLASALTRAASAAHEVGGRFVVVDAVDEAAVAFYRHQGFVSIASEPRRLILAIKDFEDLLKP